MLALILLIFNIMNIYIKKYY